MRLFALISLVALSCGTGHPPEPASVTPTAPVAGSYLALGDSYTIGEGAATADRWPVQLAALARQQQVNLLAPDIIARTGWTTAELADAIATANNPKTYDLVSLQIGVNNQYRGQSVAQYRTEFRGLLQTAVRFAANRPGRVFVLSIPDWGQSPFAEGEDRARIGADIDQFNTAAKAECQLAGVAFVDITPLSRAAAGDASQFTRDGLHYSGPQMRRWAEAALPVVQAAVK